MSKRIKFYEDTEKTLEVFPYAQAVVDSNGKKKHITCDFSGKSSVRLPIPTVSPTLNIISQSLLAPGSQDELPCEIEYTDCFGNYFKKHALMSLHGDTSKDAQKLNFAWDLYNDAECKDAFKLAFGTLPYFDAYQTKAHIRDNFIGRSQNAMDVLEDIWSVGREYKYPFEKYRESVTWNTQPTSPTAEVDCGTQPICHPTGFPIIIEWNDNFFGVYCLTLKRHRDNYKLDKQNANHIMLDLGNNVCTNVFNGSISWTVPEVDIKAPKTLYCKNGAKYDNDDNRVELDENHDDTTAAVKESMLRISNFMSNFNALPSGTTAEEKKTFISQYFDVEFCLDYLIWVYYFGLTDNTNNNMIWITYNRNIWIPTCHDAEGNFGCPIGNADNTNPNVWNNVWVGKKSINPLGIIETVFMEELKQRYAEVRKAGVLDIDNYGGRIKHHLQMIGSKNLQKDYDTWGNRSWCAVNGRIAGHDSLGNEINYEKKWTGKGYFTYGMMKDWGVQHLAFMDEKMSYTPSEGSGATYSQGTGITIDSDNDIISLSPEYVQKIETIETTLEGSLGTTYENGTGITVDNESDTISLSDEYVQKISTIEATLDGLDAALRNLLGED